MGGHRAVARDQEAVRDLMDGFVHGESDPRRLRKELERPADRRESHFTYEEEAIVRARNTAVRCRTGLMERLGWHVSDPTYPHAKRNFAIREIVRS
jgi:hypothetical protein